MSFRWFLPCSTVLYHPVKNRKRSLLEK